MDFSATYLLHTILAIKQPGTPNKSYKYIFIVCGHRDKDIDLIIHTSQTFLHRNMSLMSSIAVILPSKKIFLQDVTKAYIQGHDLER